MTKKELKALPKTTKKQADQIKKRCNGLLCAISDDNIAILKLNKLPRGWKRKERIISFRAKVGCPHCQDAHKLDNMDCCSKCLWVETICEDAKFNGVNLISLCGNYPLALYFSRQEEVLEIASSPEINAASWIDNFDDCIEDARKFLDGHIEWADLVLKGEME